MVRVPSPGIRRGLRLVQRDRGGGSAGLAIGGGAEPR
jgi:hypothetical protein